MGSEIVDMKTSSIVLKYLRSNIDYSNPNSLIDWVQEMSEGYDTVPEKVNDAFNELDSQELWEIIRKIAAEAKKKLR
jgi:hypothetical protein